MAKQSRYAKTAEKAAVYPLLSDTRGYELKYFEGLCAERKEYVTNRYGQARVMWSKDPATPNEPLDLFAYSLAAVNHLVGIGNLLAFQRRADDILGR